MPSDFCIGGVTPNEDLPTNPAETFLLKMKIKIPFKNWSIERLNTGQKVCTARNEKYGEPGDTFDVGDNTYEIKKIVKLSLWFVRDFLWYPEGAKSPEEFVKVWKDIHPIKGFVNNQIVYEHFFREIIYAK